MQQQQPTIQLDVDSELLVQSRLGAGHLAEGLFHAEHLLRKLGLDGALAWLNVLQGNGSRESGLGIEGWLKPKLSSVSCRAVAAGPRAPSSLSLRRRCWCGPGLQQDVQPQGVVQPTPSQAGQGLDLTLNSPSPPSVHVRTATVTEPAAHSLWASAASSSSASRVPLQNKGQGAGTAPDCTLLYSYALSGGSMRGCTSDRRQQGWRTSGAVAPESVTGLCWT